MKRKFVFVILLGLVITLLLNSCSLGGLNMQGRLYDNDESIANARMDKILEAINKKDKNTLKEMFSKKAITNSKNIDKSIDDLFSFFKGTVISINDWGGPGASEGMNDDGTGRNWKYIDSTYDVKTSKQKYRFAIREFTIDTANKDNIGICSLYIIKEEDDTDPKFAYWGDGNFTPGINLNKKNVIPGGDS